MKLYTLAEAKELTLDEAKLAINQAVYAATQLLEKLEQAGKCSGNDARQHIAGLAAEELEYRWRLSELETRTRG